MWHREWGWENRQPFLQCRSCRGNNPNFFKARLDHKSKNLLNSSWKRLGSGCGATWDKSGLKSQLRICNLLPALLVHILYAILLLDVRWPWMFLAIFCSMLTTTMPCTSYYPSFMCVAHKRWEVTYSMSTLRSKYKWWKNRIDRKIFMMRIKVLLWAQPQRPKAIEKLVRIDVPAPSLSKQMGKALIVLW
jgi:hypothetical protein